MKKMLFGLSLSVAALALLVSPAMAASSPQAAPALSAADQAFLASLAAPAGTPAPELVAKRPRIGTKSLCTATANCWNGGTVSCSGNNSTTSCTAVDGNCSVGERGHVTCDGVTTACPTACPCPSDFCITEEDNCAANCSPCSYTFTCSLSTCTDHCHCNFRTCPP
jgi:hypothetical protein